MDSPMQGKAPVSSDQNTNTGSSIASAVDNAPSGLTVLSSAGTSSIDANSDIPVSSNGPEISKALLEDPNMSETARIGEYLAASELTASSLSASAGIAKKAYFTEAVSTNSLKPQLVFQEGAETTEFKVGTGIDQENSIGKISAPKIVAKSDTELVLHENIQGQGLAENPLGVLEGSEIEKNVPPMKDNAVEEKQVEAKLSTTSSDGGFTEELKTRKISSTAQKGSTSNHEQNTEVFKGPTPTSFGEPSADDNQISGLQDIGSASDANIENPGTDISDSSLIEQGHGLDSLNAVDLANEIPIPPNSNEEDIMPPTDPFLLPTTTEKFLLVSKRQPGQQNQDECFRPHTYP